MNVLKDQDDISENSVFSQGKMKDHEIEKLQDKLQNTHEPLTKNFEKLKEKVTGEKDEKIFRDPRVNELWERAKDGGLSEEELESFKVNNIFLFFLPNNLAIPLIFMTA